MKDNEKNKKRYYHSVRLKEDDCKGCTHCIRTCPTQAIRVYDGKATIIEERCIDCGECIRTCPNFAKYAHTDSLDMLNDFKYTVALPAPSFMAQFDPDDIPLDKVYTALNLMGFEYIFEVAAAAELVNKATEKFMQENKKRPVISSACPAVVRLILTRFPEYAEYIAPLEPPMDIAAKISKDMVMKKTGCNEKEVGVFFISPCPAKVTAVNQPEGKKKSPVDGVFSMTDVFDAVMSRIQEIKETKNYEHAGKYGIIWGVHEGEIRNVHVEKKIAVAGIHNIISFFENVDDKEFSSYEFIEVQACIPGCVGGVLAPTDKFMAKTRLKRLAGRMKESTVKREKVFEDYDMKFFIMEFFNEGRKLQPRSINRLDTDIEKAMEKAEKIDVLMKEFPGIDCGICGCPTCETLAEDVVQGKASKFDCIFVLKEKIKNIKEELGDISSGKRIKDENK
ncbi:MAG: ferredoxin [Candidatus Muiribacterium halophilum]|uniref:Ferredoxin n=1 Tax=Muiribacterium halophilum TaxID=2053465 RepID=A0A2N5ZFG6_MUIH1|nr:MAG: ferredoxin [Candidatus Muirbacterium halophilum]